MVNCIVAQSREKLVIWPIVPNGMVWTGPF
jgi:hypothetical protein